MVPLADALAPKGFAERTEAMRLALAASVSASLDDVEPRTAMGTLHLGLVSRVWSIALGCWALTRVMPDLSPQHTWVGTGVRSPIPWATDGPTFDTDPVAVLERTALPSVLAIGEAALRDGLPTKAVESNAGSSLVAAASVVMRALPDAGAALGPLVPALLGHEALRGSGELTPRGFRRSGCCLYYRVPGGGLCGDCVLQQRNAH